MEGSGEAEGDGPGEGAVFDNLGEVVGGLFDGLTTRKEDDAGEVIWDVGFKDFGGFGSDFCRGRLSFLLFAGEDHIDLEDTSAEINFIIGEFLEEAIEDFAGG